MSRQHKEYKCSLGKDNFWNRKRIEYGIKSKELAELLGCGEKSASSYFTGQCMPSKKNVELLCNFFNVDIAEGEVEFQKIYDEYWATHKKPVYGVKKPRVEIKSSDIDSPTTSNNDSNVMEILYGELDFDEYNRIEELGLHGTDILKSIYRVVDYDLYTKIEKILKR